MRKMDTCLAGLLWIAAATLLPLAALEPVGAATLTEDRVSADAACADGSAHLAMGCTSVSL